MPSAIWPSAGRWGAGNKVWRSRGGAPRNHGRHAVALWDGDWRGPEGEREGWGEVVVGCGPLSLVVNVSDLTLVPVSHLTAAMRCAQLNGADGSSGRVRCRRRKLVMVQLLNRTLVLFFFLWAKPDLEVCSMLTEARDGNFHVKDHSVGQWVAWPAFVSCAGLLAGHDSDAWFFLLVFFSRDLNCRSALCALGNPKTWQDLCNRHGRCPHLLLSVSLLFPLLVGVGHGRGARGHQHPAPR